MKKLLHIILMLAAVVVTAQAQLQGPSTVNVIANVTSNTPVGTLTIDCRRQQNVAIFWEYQLGGAGTEVMGIRFVPSTRADAIPTTPTLADGFFMAQAANGTTAVRVSTNFNVKGFPYLHLWYITNGNASQVLTNKLYYHVKPNAP